MLLAYIADKIDLLLRSYLGLEEEEVKTHSVKRVDDNLVIFNSEPFKRHLLMQSWENFSSTDFKNSSPENKEKIGIAAGKAIAKNLVISFQDTDSIEADPCVITSPIQK
jgi:hypothetical protein